MLPVFTSCGKETKKVGATTPGFHGPATVPDVNRPWNAAVNMAAMDDGFGFVDATTTVFATGAASPIRTKCLACADAATAAAARTGTGPTATITSQPRATRVFAYTAASPCGAEAGIAKNCDLAAV